MMTTEMLTTRMRVQAGRELNKPIRDLWNSAADDFEAQRARIAKLEAELTTEKELIRHMMQAHTRNLESIGAEFKVERDALQSSLTTVTAQRDVVMVVLKPFADCGAESKIGTPDLIPNGASLMYLNVGKVLQAHHLRSAHSVFTSIPKKVPTNET